MRQRVPVGVFLLILGYASGEFCVWLGWDTGLRWDNFQIFITQFVIPVLVFHNILAFSSHSDQPPGAPQERHPSRNLFLSVLLSFPLTLLLAGLSAILIYIGIGSPQGFPWSAALLTGALLSCTDASPLLAATRRLPARAQALLRSESLGTEASAIALFMFLLEFLAGPASTKQGGTLGSVILYFCYYIGGGLLLGAIAAWLTRPLLALARTTHAQLLLTLPLAYGLNLFANAWLGISGVLAVAAAALVLRSHLDRGARENKPGRSQNCRAWWNASGRTLEYLMFLLAGVTFQLIMFEKRWLAMLIGIGAVLAARALVLALLTPALPQGQRLELLPPLFWGGSCGIVTLALALSLPTGLSYWFTIQSIAYGVVLFGLLAQGTTFPRLCDRSPSATTTES